MELQPDSSSGQVQVEPSTPLSVAPTSAFSALLQRLLFHLLCGMAGVVCSHMATGGQLFRSKRHSQPPNHLCCPCALE